MTLTNPLTKIATALVAISLVVGVAFSVAPRAEAAALTSSQIQAIISLLQSFGADSATVANVTASLNGTAPSVPSAPSSSCTFTRDLTIGSKGTDVTCLQNALIAAGYSIPAGATGYFGAQTQTAVAAWQKAAGITPTAGYFGAKSRAAWGMTTSTNPTTPAPTGTGLSVSAGAALANSLSPQGATRVPFTNFNVTAGNDGDVVVNSVTVQRVGLGQDAAFAGVVLVDLDSGKQLGTARTFNSNHQANIGETLTVARGTTRHFQVAANMASSLASYAGEAPALSVIGINTSATVSGTLPITGAYNTNNATLTVGSLALDVSNASASNANATKEIGTTGYKFTGLRLTAGSAEDVWLKSITFNQSGSVSASDLANVMVNVNGTNYPTTLSTDGRYYTANLGTGVLIGKGNQVEVYLMADIVGSNSSGRTVIFDVDKTTDIYGVGGTYGYGISPTTAGGSAVSGLTRGTSNTTETTGTPYVFASVVTVSGASVSTIAKANEVPAQNIAINLSNQPLGGYVVDLKGENVTVASTVVTFATSSAALGSGGLTNITIVDENGSVVAGPVDATCVSSCTATFSDTITYKTGRHIFTIRGKVGSTASNGAVITASTNPSAWGTVRGEITGNTITLSQTSFNMNAMTVKAGALVIGPATSPASQTITPGGSSVLMANFQFDATQSGEDVRFSSIPADLAYATGDETELTSCQIFDGSTALNTGSNVVNPSETGASPIDVTFTLDNPVTVAKGTVKTLGVRCNVSGSATNNATFAWAPGTTVSFITSFSVTGAVSGTSITPTASSGTAPTFTIGTGSVAVSTDASNPSYTLASAGTTNVTNTVMKIRSTNEDVNLTKLGLQLTNTASSSASDLVKATVWDGATKVGEAFFLGGSTVATSTFATPVALTKNIDKVLTVKLDLANIGTGEAVTFSGHLVAVDFKNAEGTGAQSGTTIFPTGSASSNGTRVMKSFPTFSLDSTVNGTTGLADGRLMRFKVTADAAGPVGITQFALNLATTTVSLSNVTIYGFTDSSYSTAISGVTSSGDLQATDDCTAGCSATSPNIVVGVTTSGGTATAIQIPAGQTRYFEVRASVSGDATGAAVTTKILGSSSFPSTSAGVSANPLLAASASGVSSSDNVFVWSPNSTTTAVRGDVDWTNGYGVSGLPAGGLFATRSH